MPCMKKSLGQPLRSGPIPLTNDLIFLAVDDSHPYVKILQGQQGYHGFVHNGESLHYSPITLENGKIVGDQEFHQRVNQAASAYVSVSPELESSFLLCHWEQYPSPE